MAANETLLSRIARHHTIGREDVATDALAFILSRSPAAHAAFANFLGDGDTESPAIANVRTQYTLSNGPAPDMACLDHDGNILAFVESKFWAGLTHNQPVTYWQALPTDTPATLLFLAPAYRIHPGGLWSELAGRLEQSGHPLADPVHLSDYTTTAPAQDDSQRRLMVASWKTLLGHLQQSALDQSDWQALFEITQLQGLANSVITGSDPSREDNLKRLVTSAVREMVQDGWANGFHVGRGYGYWGRYMQLAGVNCWFGIDYDEIRRSGRPLWLVFFAQDSDTAVQVRLCLATLSLNEIVERRFRSYDFCIPVPIPPGADDESALNSIVDQLTAIASRIDPNGPTYRKDAPNA